MNTAVCITRIARAGLSCHENLRRAEHHTQTALIIVIVVLAVIVIVIPAVIAIVIAIIVVIVIPEGNSVIFPVVSKAATWEEPRLTEIDPAVALHPIAGLSVTKGAPVVVPIVLGHAGRYRCAECQNQCGGCQAVFQHPMCS
ncbi:hypothetical protein [Azospirillum sp. SYSU D00513]|uniref:hypothetical protein n=1 Tax=Azospirillum sp. SYSU D00513 TaxID=2812561 RepID=UPI001A974DC1|nr:hypothetical protein [Azospirillum sp. SYSU D00513]